MILTKAGKCGLIAGGLAIVSVMLIDYSALEMKADAGWAAVVFALFALKFQFLSLAHRKGKIRQ